jgi:hypothetical protein
MRKGKKYGKWDGEMVPKELYTRFRPKEIEIFDRHMKENYPRTKAVWIRKVILEALIKERKGLRLNL